MTFRHYVNDSLYKLPEFRIIILTLKTLSFSPGQLPPPVGGQRFLAMMTNKFKLLMTLFDITLFESSIEFFKLFFLFVFFSCSNYRI